MSRSKITHVARGITFGDVSNQSVRNILSEISKEIFGKFTDTQMEETMEYFGWCCPYTGRYLKDEYYNGTGNYATDHIYPQNRVWCGLNVKGNLVLVDKHANNKKGDQSVDEFLLYDTDALGCLDDATRQARLQKIKDFQAKAGYEAQKIKDSISHLMQARYAKVKEDQELCITDALSALSDIGIRPMNASVVKATKKVSGVKADKEDDFKKYLIEDCGRTNSTANAYKVNRDKIMKELKIFDITSLEKCIDDVIDYCTREKDQAKKNGDSKKEKLYNDCRSALRKYKDFMNFKKISP
jgi:CRISPR/Cas system Type II protein with McrA/HNH and RuvC-like nuclease domain